MLPESMTKKKTSYFAAAPRPRSFMCFPKSAGATLFFPMPLSSARSSSILPLN